MKKFLIATSLFAFFGLSFGISNAQESSVTIQEKSSERAGKIFDAIDENADGNINKDEFVQFHSKLVEKRMEKFMPEAKPENVENVEIQIKEETTITEETSEIEENGDVTNSPEEEVIIEEDETETTTEEPSF